MLELVSIYPHDFIWPQCLHAPLARYFTKKNIIIARVHHLKIIHWPVYNMFFKLYIGQCRDHFKYVKLLSRTGLLLLLYVFDVITVLCMWQCKDLGL